MHDECLIHNEALLGHIFRQQTRCDEGSGNIQV